MLLRILFVILLPYLVNLKIQINFHLTEWENENDGIQHDCFNIAALVEEEYDLRQVIPYCMGEWPSTFNISENNFEEKFNFSQLSKQSVTTEQLYQWSASIDLIEKYQIYLDELPYSDKTQLAAQIFYNCTSPYFGSQCQYTFNSSYDNHSSLNDIIYDYYYYNRYEPTEFTCYVHLECNRGPYPSCLDWTEICDGKVDCLNGGVDEKDCWQVEIQECEENEHKCSYGQCIPKAFIHDNRYAADCLDQLDEELRTVDFLRRFQFFTNEPIFKFEDVSCGKLNNMRQYSTPILTSSCEPQREVLLSRAMFSIRPSSINNQCWAVLLCIIQMPDSLKLTVINLFSPPPVTNCSEFCKTGSCNDISQEHCSEIMFIPAYPILHGHIYLAYHKSKLTYTRRPLEPTYVCYDDKHLDVPDDGKTFLLTNNKTCRLYADSKVGAATFFETRWLQLFIGPIGRWLHRHTLSVYDNSTASMQSIMYQCLDSSKLIPKSRLLDFVVDCYLGDDEDVSRLNNTILVKQLPNVVKCSTTDQYIQALLVNDEMQCDCTTPGDDYCADETLGEVYFNKTISFQTICDKILHLSSEFTVNKNETDETNCEHWPLLHIYNRCDGFWHFLDGSDEVNCDSSLSLLNCPETNHICVSPQTKDLICLPIEKANDGIVDCIGAADEPKICQRNNRSDQDSEQFSCINNGQSPCIFATELCDGIDDCPHKEDEEVCKTTDLKYNTIGEGICTKKYELHGSSIAKVLCRLFFNNAARSQIYFTLDQSSNPVIVKREYNFDTYQYFSDDRPAAFNFYQPYCHRGLPIKVWFDKQTNLTKTVCLCPPSFYGNICQYQNQRISVTLQFHATSDSSQIPFIFIISLIDDTNERLIHSYEQFNYVFAKYCQRKFNFYLLYSTRPKDSLKNYSIHIDIYEQITLKYRGSFIKSIKHSFLPVHRLALKFDIPRSSDQIEICSKNADKKCIHGKCRKYYNGPNEESFCQCDKGWIGQYCTMKYTCSCSSHSLCLGKLTNNRSLCVCPLTKMGPRCIINDNICLKETCMNGGTCIRTDEYALSQKFTCICPKGYSGDRCEIARTKLLISFEKNPDTHSIVFLHFIQAEINDFPVRTTTFRRFLPEQNSLLIRWSLPFHILFIELSDETYYLILMQKKYEHQSMIEKRITSLNRCLHINELFNETFQNYQLLRRIKYYHIPCQTNFSLSCFYDEQQFCLCQQLDHQRLANCFNFDRYSRTVCARQDDCKNGGTCFQENSKCPQYFLCKCPECYHGERCQLNINGYSLSLDTILGVYIQSNVKIFNQPRVVVISTIVSTILILVGFLNGILSLITFKNDKIRETGCGIYLLNSSIIILFTMIIFAMKFWIVLLSQIGTIQNQLFLKVQCHSIDFLLRLCLTMDLWLTAFVSIERAFITIKGMNFNKKKTKLIAKYTICILLLIIVLTNIQDPIYRKLDVENNDDNDEQRFRCIVQYTSSIRIIDYIINAFYFIGPFLINLISAGIIIIVKTRQRKAIIGTKQNLPSILKEEIQQHKNLLIGPLVLLILVIPRLIITFASGCMKSINDAGLFLLGYFISLIPPTLTFILFVLPSTVYKQEFYNAIRQYRRIFQRNS